MLFLPPSFAEKVRSRMHISRPLPLYCRAPLGSLFLFVFFFQSSLALHQSSLFSQNKDTNNNHQTKDPNNKQDTIRYKFFIVIVIVIVVHSFCFIRIFLASAPIYSSLIPAFIHQPEHFPNPSIHSSTFTSLHI